MRIWVFGQNLPPSLALLAVVEAILFFLVLVGAGLTRFGLDLAATEAFQGPLWPRGLLFSAMMFTSLLAFGLYSVRQRSRGSGLVVRVVVAVGAGAAATAIFLFMVPDLRIGRGVFALAVMGAAVVVSGVRLTFSRLAKGDIFKRRIIVYGAGVRAAAIARLRRRSDQRYFTLVGYVPCESDRITVPVDRLLRSNSSLLALCRRHAVDEIVVAMDDRRLAFPVRDLLECRVAGIEVTELLSFLERETGRVQVDMLNPSWLIFGEGFRRGSIRLFTSYVLDIVASMLILVLALPTIVAVTLAIKLEDGLRAPVLYRQERVGLRGRTFELLKFRSMRVDAEAAGSAQWAQKNDPRVTHVGRIMRLLRIDELPQIINVVRGDMSFVGPRPERPQFVAALAERIPYYAERHCVKPGITGWAQLCFSYGASEQDAAHKLQYDLYYIKNNSLLFDLSILVQTVEVVVLGNGAR